MKISVFLWLVQFFRTASGGDPGSQASSVSPKEGNFVTWLGEGRDGKGQLMGGTHISIYILVRLVFA